MRHAEIPLLAMLTFIPGMSRADGIDLLYSRPALSQAHFLGLDPPEVLEPMLGLAGVQADGAAATLTPSGSGTPLSSWALSSTLHARLGLLPWLDSGVELPMTLVQDARQPDGTGSVGGAFGDARLDVRARMPITSTDFQLLLASRLTLPTGSPETWTGEAGPTLHPRLVMGGALPALRWTSTLGMHLRGNTRVVQRSTGEWEQVGSALTWGLGMEAGLLPGLRWGLEAEGQVGGQAGSFDDPTELRGGISWDIPKIGQLKAGMGFGLGGGYSSASWRTFAGLSLPIAPSKIRSLDPDGDSIFARADRCPDEPEDRDGFEDRDGCPDKDNDQDGIVDLSDQCPTDPETLNEFQDGDGCPDQVTDTDGDGVADHLDRCVPEAEDRDAFEDSDGCPEPDNDHDGLSDEIDQCPDGAEIFNGLNDEDGCPDQDMVFTSTAGGARGAARSRSAVRPAIVAESSLPSPSAQNPAGSAASVAVASLGPFTEKGLPPTAPGPEAVQGVAPVRESSPGDSASSKPSAGGSGPSPAVAPDPSSAPNTARTAQASPTRRTTEPPSAAGDDAKGASLPAGSGGYLDSDGDGVVDPRDKCPDEPELRNGVQDNDGCPEPDSDEDGLVDPVDKCPKRAETPNGYEDDDGCPEPDTDLDGIIDGLDTCPKVPETVNGLKDMDGCPEQDTDGDGFYDLVDKCPARPETVNGLQDDDGCPEPDTDKDGFPDGLDKCPNQVETANGIQDDDGCPDGDQLPDDRTARASGASQP